MGGAKIKKAILQTQHQNRLLLFLLKFSIHHLNNNTLMGSFYTHIAFINLYVINNFKKSSLARKDSRCVYIFFAPIKNKQIFFQ